METVAFTDKKLHIFNGVILQMPERMNAERFYQFCLCNPDLRAELDSNGQIFISPFVGSALGNKKAEFLGEVGIWNRLYHLGAGFDGSTGFLFPNGAVYSPSASWIRSERWKAIPEEQRKRFAPIAPDFVAEIRSGDQNIGYLKDKMEEYIANGCRLAWLIDPESRKTWVYFENGDIQTIPFDTLLSGGEVMPGFEILLADIFTIPE